MELADLLNYKKILIWGFGREGEATLRFIRSHCEGTVVDVADGRELSFAQGDGVRRFLLTPAGSKPDMASYDCVFKTPGIPLDGLTKEELRKLTSITQLFIQTYRSQIIGITGTKGKSTTASLIAHILQNSGVDSVLLGNIGLPCVDFVDRITPKTKIVFELSCHQLEMLTVSPSIAVLLNLYPDHLDHYGTFEHYAKAKEQIIAHQQAGDVAIVNEQVFALGFGQEVRAAARTKGIRYVITCNENASGEDGFLPDPSVADIDVKGRVIHFGAGDPDTATAADPASTITIEETATKLRGLHNVYNIGIAYEVCCKLCSVSHDQFMAALADFEGLAHRLQMIGTFGGVDFYDDSISTVCETSIAAVESVKNAQTLIIGGMDRGIDYTPLVDYMCSNEKRAEAAICRILLLPDTHTRIMELFLEKEQKGRKAPALIPCADLRDAVEKAIAQTTAGGACILSPAAASYGFFKNFEERGDCFAKLVRELSGSKQDEA